MEWDFDPILLVSRTEVMINRDSWGHLCILWKNLATITRIFSRLLSTIVVLTN